MRLPLVRCISLHRWRYLYIITHCNTVIKDEVTVFEVNSHDGYPVTYEWNFGDQTDVITELNGKVNHSFSSSGRYNVTVRAYNELSEDIAWVRQRFSYINLSLTNEMEFIGWTKQYNSFLKIDLFLQLQLCVRFYWINYSKSSCLMVKCKHFNWYMGTYFYRPRYWKLLIWFLNIIYFYQCPPSITDLSSNPG